MDLRYCSQKIGKSRRKKMQEAKIIDAYSIKKKFKVTGHSKMFFFCRVSPISTRLFCSITCTFKRPSLRSLHNLSPYGLKIRKNYRNYAKGDKLWNFKSNWQGNPTIFFFYRPVTLTPPCVHNYKLLHCSLYVCMYEYIFLFMYIFNEFCRELLSWTRLNRIVQIYTHIKKKLENKR